MAGEEGAMPEKSKYETTSSRTPLGPQLKPLLEGRFLTARTVLCHQPFVEHNLYSFMSKLTSHPNLTAKTHQHCQHNIPSTKFTCLRAEIE